MNKPKSKVNIFLIVLLAAVTVISAIFILDISKENGRGRIFLNTAAGMDTEQRAADFEDMCNFLEKNVPFIYDYEELYGVGFEDMKNHYLQLVKSAETDFEYYAAVQGFVNNIPSGHFTLGYPNPDYIPALYTYRTGDYPEFSGVCEYWENVIHEECAKHYGGGFRVMPYYYIDGEYIQSEYFSAECETEYYGAKLISADGVPIDEFVLLSPLGNKLHYDFQNEKAFREMIVFNDSFGTECEVEYETESGERRSEKMYYGTKADIILSYIDYFYWLDNNPNEDLGENENSEDNEADYSAGEVFGEGLYAYTDSEKNILYLKLYDFTYGGSEALKILDSGENPDNIIIDLRDNGGGMESICNALAERLSDRDFEYGAEVYSVEKPYDDTAKRALKPTFKTNFKKLYSHYDSNSLTGKAEKKYSIFVLVSHPSLSAADRFASIVKDNGLGTVIGAFNSGGEGYGSPDLKVLEKSGLYFYFTPYKSLNKDGTDNSVYGTSPDIYAKIDREAFKKRDEQLMQGIDCSTYENRLKWDNVLLTAVEIIEENQ